MVLLDLLLLILGVWATMGVLGCLPVAWWDWEDGARVLPVLKKRRKRAVGAIVASMRLTGLGLGVATCTDVSKRDLLGVLVLVRGGLLAGRVAGVVANANVVFLHVGSGNSIDALAGVLLLWSCARATVACSTATAVAVAGSTGSVDQVGVWLFLLNEVTTDTFQAFLELGPWIGPFKFTHLPGPDKSVAELKDVLVSEVEAHGNHELLKRQFVGELGIELVGGCVQHCHGKPPIHQLMESQSGMFGSHVAGSGRLEGTMRKPVLPEDEARTRCVETGRHDLGHFGHVDTFQTTSDFK